MATIGEITVIKTEALPFNIPTENPVRNTTLIDSPEKINKDVLHEFNARLRQVNLITLNRKKWSTTISNFDNEFIHVIAPQGFKIFIGELVIVEFPTDNNNFIIQTIQHKYAIQRTDNRTMSTVLSLKFLDPRMDKRYTAPENIKAGYVIINTNACWLTDNRYFMARKTGYRTGGEKCVAVHETFGFKNGSNTAGAEDISFLDKEIHELTNDMQQADMDNISTGGCSIRVADKDLKPESLLFLSVTLTLKGIMYKFNSLELLMFATVKNIRPADEYCKYGLKFVKHLDNNTLHDFFEIWSNQEHPISNSSHPISPQHTP